MKKFFLSIICMVCGVTLATAGQGTGSNPMTVDQIVEQGTPTSPIAETVVKGYIVGFVNGMNYQSNTVFGTPASLESYESQAPTNIVIASSSGEDDIAYCLPVQLPAGEIRSALNLVDNPSNLGKMVTLVGTNEKYFGVNGIKSVIKYAWGETIDFEPTPEVPEGPVTSLDEKFAAIPSNWTVTNLAGNKSFYATSYQNDTYAAMTGYKGTAPFDAWLISPAVKINECQNKVLTFDSQVNGYGSTTTTFKAYVLSSNDPATATRTELSATYATAPASGYSGFVGSGDIDLSSFSGEIYIAFNYVATEDANYATWCVTNVKLNAGNSEVTTPSNKGTEEAPLTVAQLLANEMPNPAEAGWYVKGYIVGFVAGQNYSGAVFGTADEASNTNLLLADAVDCTDRNLCIPVQLPAGAVRDALSLSQHPENLGKLVTLGGSYEKYFGVPGLKNVKTYKFDGEVVAEHIFASLENNAAGWEVEYNMPLPEELTYIWSWDATYNNYKASSYKNQAYAADAIAISPEIDLTGKKNVSLSFSQTGKMFVSLEKAKEQCQVMIRPAGGEWSAIEIPVWFTNADWTFVDNKDIDINAYAGQKIQIGLRYISEDGAGGTWEVKKLYVDADNDDENNVESILSNENFNVRVVNGEIIAPAGAEIFSMTGMRNGNKNLEKGIYIARLGSKAMKVVVK